MRRLRAGSRAKQCFDAGYGHEGSASNLDGSQLALVDQFVSGRFTKASSFDCIAHGEHNGIHDVSPTPGIGRGGPF